MEYLIGVVLSLSLVVAGTATSVGFDRERAYYPVLLIVIASYSVLFAAMGASGRVVILASLVASVFLLTAVIGFKGSLWIVVAALVAHGVVARLLFRLRCCGWRLSGDSPVEAQEQKSGLNGSLEAAGKLTPRTPGIEHIGRMAASGRFPPFENRETWEAWCRVISARRLAAEP